MFSAVAALVAPYVVLLAAMFAAAYVVERVYGN